MSLRKTLSTYRLHIQAELFPGLEEWMGARLGPHHQQFVSVLGMVRVDALLRAWPRRPGRPPAQRATLARAFIAKAIFNLPTMRVLIETFAADRTLRRLCVWHRTGEVPSESTFCRAFREFADSALPISLHRVLIEQTHGDHLVGHISRDSTAIKTREKVAKPAQPAPPIGLPRERGRPRKGSIVAPKPPRRITRQLGMTLHTMLEDLPCLCDVGTKRNAKGYQESWIGYKLHIDSADGDIPNSCMLTAALHDSQVAIPLATMTAARVTNLHDLMDSAYDVAEIRQHSRTLGHVPIIDVNPRDTRGLKRELAAEARRQRRIGHTNVEQLRYRQRSAAERVNAVLKDNHGGRTVRVRGAAKVMCHLMFGVLSLAALKMQRLLI